MPTYAVPPWLARQYPEIAAERLDGSRVGWGARQEVDFTHPAFRFHAERVIRAIAARYAAHPAVIGFQVDNEPGLELFHNHGVFTRFVRDLKARYGDREAARLVDAGIRSVSPTVMSRAARRSSARSTQLLRRWRARSSRLCARYP